MSSANKLNLISLLSILITLMLVFFLNVFAKVSNAVINKYPDNGHPSFTPHWSLKYLLVVLLFKTVDAILLYMVFS